MRFRQQHNLIFIANSNVIEQLLIDCRAENIIFRRDEFYGYKNINMFTSTILKLNR